MRIVCPNCDAQYEIDDAAIPPEGRDVQCSNCGNAWFQGRPAGAEDLSAALYAEPPAQPEVAPALTQGAEPPPPEPSPALPKRSLDETVLSVLREEAEREMTARKVEQQGLEMQGDLGLPPPVPVSVGAASNRFEAADDEEEEEPSPASRKIAALKGEAAGRPKKAAARRDLLPDIEEINSTLKPGEQPKAPRADRGEAETAGGGGFRSGFSLMLILGVALAALYVMAPQIRQQIPGLGPALDSYVAAIDGLRIGLDGLIRKVTGLVQGVTG